MESLHVQGNMRCCLQPFYSITGPLLTQPMWTTVCPFTTIQWGLHHFIICLELGVHTHPHIHTPGIRAHALYSMVDGFQQGIFWLVGKKKIKNKICWQVHVGGINWNYANELLMSWWICIEHSGHEVLAAIWLLFGCYLGTSGWEFWRQITEIPSDTCLIACIEKVVNNLHGQIMATLCFTWA